MIKRFSFNRKSNRWKQARTQIWARKPTIERPKLYAAKFVKVISSWTSYIIQNLSWTSYIIQNLYLYF